MYYVPTVPVGWKTFGTQVDSFWCCTGSGVEEYAKLVDTIYFHDESSVYVNQFVASELSWPEKRVRLGQQTSFPQEPRTAIVVHAAQPAEFVLRIRAPHWAQGIAVTVNGRPEVASVGSDGYLALHRTWKNNDRVEVSLPMALRQEQVAGSPELATFAYGPLVLAAEMGRAGLSQELIEGSMGPKLDGISPLAMPQFDAASEAGKAGVAWIRKSDDADLRFHTSGQTQDFALKPLYQITDERYSVYWQKWSKA